ncbi:DNA-processing protein DprA [Enorma massiliensis]|nr:DNA-protecting protein DprA [Enorma massiliensis]
MMGPTVKASRMAIERGSDSYPPGILDLANAPKRLYMLGNPEALQGPAIAIVGTRRPTPYGIALTELAAKLAVEAGITVVSGGAIGCDQAAGMKALACGGVHVVVLGCGADVIYPSSSRELIDKTLDAGGAVVSIAPWGTKPQRFLFPQRNRVIAALSEAVFIGEAGMPSGTFSTAEAAMELGREVLVAPGSVFSPESRGANYLISVGACCITDEESLEIALSRIFGVLRHPHGPLREVESADPREQRVLRGLAASPMRSEDIARLAGLDARGCLEFLSDLMISGRVEQLIDGRYALTKEVLHAMTAIGQNDGSSNQR